MTTTAADRTQPSESVTVTLRLDHGYRFEADFGWPGVASIVLDEMPPLGEGAGPNPSRMLATAVAHCLSASLLFCLRKARVEVSAMETTAQATLARNEHGRLRVTRLDVRLNPTVAQADRARVPRCLEIFEDYCVVTESVRGGIEVGVDVAIAGEGSGSIDELAR